MRNITIAITTAKREIPTLNACITSVRKAKYTGVIHVFAEPGNYMIDGKNIRFYINEKKLGCFKNYDSVLKWFIEKDNNDYILILQDDFIVRTDIFKIIKKVNHEKDYGYLNVLTVAEQPGLKDFIKKEGWNKCLKGKWAWGAGYFMKKNVIKRIMDVKFYKDHMNNRTERKEKHGKMIDGCISECCKLLDLPMWYHNPSLSQHIGVSSTLEHNGYLTGYKFKLK